MINYFGYGANSTSEMMNAIIGRVPEGQNAVLHDYELFIQDWYEVPIKARSILKRGWNNSFKTYCIRFKKDSIVTGTLWEITLQERSIVIAWEFWYQNVPVGVYAGNKITQAETDVFNNYKIGKGVDGDSYEPFVTDKSSLLRWAKYVRKYAI